MLKALGKLTVASVVALAAWVATPANATVFVFHDDLNGANEVPPNGSPFFGVLDATYDDVSKVFDFRFVYSGGAAPDLEDGHIHGPGAVGVDAPILFDLSLFDDAGVTEPRGSYPQPDYQAIIDMDSAVGAGLLGAVGLTLPQFEALLLGELLYLNLHSDTFPDGENRAQFLLVDVPEPATLTLFGLGLISLAGLRRRMA